MISIFFLLASLPPAPTQLPLLTPRHMCVCVCVCVCVYGYRNNCYSSSSSSYYYYYYFIAIIIIISVLFTQGLGTWLRIWKWIPMLLNINIQSCWIPSRKPKLRLCRHTSSNFRAIHKVPGYMILNKEVPLSRPNASSGFVSHPSMKTTQREHDIIMCYR